jgi:RNA polymerase sigma factor (sigma-70 family)
MGERAERIAWFKAAVLPHEAALRRHFRRFMNGPDLDDIVAEVFARAYAADDWVRITSGKAYVFAIARNLILDNARRQKIVAFEVYADIDSLNIPHGQASPEAEVSARDELRVLNKAIDQLPPRCREVFLLRRVEEISIAEVGVRLGLSVKTVERHMTKALAYLAQALAQSDVVTIVEPNTTWRKRTPRP